MFIINLFYTSFRGFPGERMVKNQMIKNLPAMQEMRVQSPGLEDTPRERNCNPLQYSCLENPMDRGACGATVHGVAKS